MRLLRDILWFCGFYKDEEAFWKHFQRNWAFIKLIRGFYRDNKSFWRILQKNGRFCLKIRGFPEDFNSFWRLFQRNWGLQGFLNKFVEKKKENEGFFSNVRFLKDFEAFKYIFREVEAFV
jgi:hypothetical protein